MAVADRDLSDEALAYIVKRLNRLFNEREVWPFLGLQYRVGEVGRNRIEPRELRRALAELANNRRPRRGKIGEPGPWEPTPGIFASPEITLEEAYHASIPLIERSRHLTDLDHGEILDRLRAVVEVATGTFVLKGNETDAPPATATPRAGGTAFTTTRDLVCHRRAITMWLTHEAEWLYPDDPNLWAFLSRCLDQGTAPLVVARHIHRATFALFRLLEVRGVQYYSMLVPEEAHDRLVKAAKEVGWAHVRPVEELADHPVIDQVHASMRYLESHPARPEVREAIQVAVDSGLTATAGPEALLSWARHTGTDAGRPWETAIQQWISWGAYRPPRRPGLPKGGIPEVLKRTACGESLYPRSSSASGEADAPEDAEHRTESAERCTFGRETTISRVPIRLR